MFGYTYVTMALFRIWCPASKSLSVFFSGRKQFVDAFVNHAFNASVERVFENFKRGFFKVCEVNLVEIFTPEQLQTIMVGQEDYDWEVFKQVPWSELLKSQEWKKQMY